MALINKQKAIDEIRDFQAQVTCDFSQDWENGMNEGFDHAVGVIELMETEDAEPVRHGHWIVQYKTKDGRSIRCSECRMSYWVGYGRDGNYCPFCGAKMDAQEKDDETE